MELNMPWVHSPFFEEELAKRQLSEDQKALAETYHKEGYLHLKNVVDSSRVDALVAELSGKHDDKFSFEDPRSLDLWRESEKVAQLAALPELTSLIEALYGRKPIPFQTLNFKYGSQQRAHSDTIHFNSLPKSYMCGVWVALEDVDEENGTLSYYPGSHHLAEYDYSMFHKHFNKKHEAMAHRKDYTNHYEPFIEKLMQHRGIKATNLKAKKGDVLIWSANLVHGGLPVKDKNRTRWSQVTHYFFEDCLYTTPMLSNPVAGEWFLRQIRNIGTGEIHKGTYNGQEVNRKRITGQRTLISSQAGLTKRDIDIFIGRVYNKLFGKR
jgi:ectoine hydroxylase-related dioxygenase (phytanoyl-CoA dioxygenase family)